MNKRQSLKSLKNSQKTSVDISISNQGLQKNKILKAQCVTFQLMHWHEMRLKKKSPYLDKVTKNCFVFY